MKYLFLIFQSQPGVSYHDTTRRHNPETTTRWRQQGHPKCWYCITSLNGVARQKTATRRRQHHITCGWDGKSEPFACYQDRLV